MNTCVTNCSNLHTLVKNKNLTDVSLLYLIVLCKLFAWTIICCSCIKNVDEMKQTLLDLICNASIEELDVEQLCKDVEESTGTGSGIDKYCQSQNPTVITTSAF